MDPPSPKRTLLISQYLTSFCCSWLNSQPGFCTFPSTDKPYLPRTHAQGVKQSVCPSVIVVGMKIAISRLLGVCACYKHNQSIDIGEKLVYTRFKLLKKAY